MKRAGFYKAIRAFYWYCQESIVRKNPQQMDENQKNRVYDNSNMFYRLKKQLQRLAKIEENSVVYLGRKENLAALNTLHRQQILGW